MNHGLNSKRTLILLWLVCIPLILAALAVRVSRNFRLPPVVFTHDGSGDSVSMGPSSSFYDDTNADNSGAYTLNNSVVGNSSNTVIPATGNAPSIVTQGPAVSAQAYIVGDVSTGHVYIQKNVQKVLPVASMSKLITALAVMDTVDPDATIEITPEEAAVASDTSMLVSGEKFRMKELLYPMLLNSSNVAAEALASSSNRAKFLELMTSYSWEVGMPSTFFADPSGIDPLNQSTAGDFFALARYLYASRPDILAITRTEHYAVATTTDHNSHIFESIHPFIAEPGFIGGKTGHTPEAKDTLLTIVSIQDEPIAIIVIGSYDRARDTSILIDRVKNILARVNH